MFNIHLLLFYEFFKIGILAIGGGYATIPFLLNLSNVYRWYTCDELTDMIAVSNITPGPVGINMATYTGFKISGISGSITTSFAIILGPFIITLICIYFLNKFKKSKIISCIFTALRPASCALLCYVMIKLIHQNVSDLKSFIMVLILLFLYKFFKKMPGLIILTGAVLGICFNAF